MLRTEDKLSTSRGRGHWINRAVKDGAKGTMQRMKRDMIEKYVICSTSIFYHEHHRAPKKVMRDFP